MDTIRRTWWVVVIFLFLSFWNISKTYLLIEDTARDSVRMIEIWQKKELTLVGPPASLGQRSEREFYLGSLSYYLGIFGLIVTNFQVWGAILMQILIFASSIPAFYWLLKDRLEVNEPLLGVMIYAFSPLVVTHMRFYWNPNAIFGAATWFWFLVINKRYVWAGLLAGLISNLHYMTVVPLLFVGIMSVNFWLGLLLGTAPTWIFELRNDFFLSRTFWFNLTHRVNSEVSWKWFVDGLSRYWEAIVGIKPMEIPYESLLSGNWQKILAFVLVLLVIWGGIRLKMKQKMVFMMTMLFVGIVGLISNGDYYGRYLFGLYPVFVWLLLIGTERVGKIVLYLVLIFIMSTNWKILINTPSKYVSIDILERASQLIKEDNPKGRYNLTENIYGDAQARGLRYFVWKNVENKPENEVSYGWLESLYILTPSLEKTKRENRYEYYAPALYKVSWEKDLGSVRLLKMVAE